jgi:hypothetical protein
VVSGSDSVCVSCETLDDATCIILIVSSVTNVLVYTVVAYTAMRDEYGPDETSTPG